MSQRKGFTFVELLVAMLVFSALSALAVPRYRSFKERAYVATLKSELGQIRIAEEAHWAEHLTYTVLPSVLDWRPTTHVSVKLASGDLGGGYVAVATHSLLSGVECATFVGKEATTTPSGDIVCGANASGGIGTGVGTP